MLVLAYSFLSPITVVLLRAQLAFRRYGCRVRGVRMPPSSRTMSKAAAAAMLTLFGLLAPGPAGATSRDSVQCVADLQWASGPSRLDCSSISMSPHLARPGIPRSVRAAAAGSTSIKVTWARPVNFGGSSWLDYVVWAKIPKLVGTCTCMRVNAGPKQPRPLVENSHT